MLERTLLAIIVGLLVAPATGGSAAAHEGHQQPNVLLLFTDDQRADTVSAWGNTTIQTPNLDDLVRQGTSFRQNYCFGSWHGAVCVPSRAMLMSGRHMFQVDGQISGVVTMPEWLQKHGYTTFATGKWHNGKESLLRSFQHGKSVMLGGMSDHNHVPIHDIGSDGQLTPGTHGQRHSSELFADAAVEFLSRHHGDAPFFCYVAFTAPHDPRDPPTRYRQMYYDRRPPLPHNFMPQHPFDNGQLVLRDENLAAWPRTPEVISDQLAEYYGLITHVDEQIGRVLAALANSPHARDTIIIYAADHGLALGSHGLLGKQSLYEHSMRCPLVIAGPGLPQDQSSDSLTYLFDVFPTICELLGLETPAEMAGHSLVPVLKNPDTDVRDSVFLAYAQWMRAVRDSRWKLIRYPHINHSQLFDLANDPHELNNLAEQPEHAATLDRLTQRMEQWRTRVGDDTPLHVDQPRPFHRDLTGHARSPDKWQPTWIVDKYFDAQPAATGP